MFVYLRFVLSSEADRAAFARWEDRYEETFEHRRFVPWVRLEPAAKEAAP